MLEQLVELLRSLIEDALAYAYTFWLALTYQSTMWGLKLWPHAVPSKASFAFSMLVLGLFIIVCLLAVALFFLGQTIVQKRRMVKK